MTTEEKTEIISTKLSIGLRCCVGGSGSNDDDDEHDARAELCIWQPTMYTWRPIMYLNKRAALCTPPIKKIMEILSSASQNVRANPSNFGHACIRSVHFHFKLILQCFGVDTCQKAVMTYSNDQQPIRACHSHTDDYVRCVVLTPQVFCLWLQYVQRIESSRMHENNDNSNANSILTGVLLFPSTFGIEMLLWRIGKKHTK